MQLSSPNLVLPLLLLLIACTESRDELFLGTSEPVETAELVSTVQSPFGPSKQKGKKGLEQSVKNCIKQVKRIVPAGRRLKKHLGQQAQIEDNSFNKVTKLESTHCTGPLIEKSQSLLKELLAKHPQKIGVILPLSGVNKNLGEAIALGIRSAENEENGAKSVKSRFIFKDSASEASGALHALAELVFYDEVSIVIGGVSKESAAAIAPYSKRLSLPMLILNKDHSVVAEHPYTVQVYPNERDQAKALAKLSRDRGYRSIAILRPSHGKSDDLIRNLQEELAWFKIRVVDPVSYIPSDYESMNKAAGLMTQTAPGLRTEEFKALLSQAKEAALEQKIPFNPSQVVLEPKLIADAVFIPDHFHMVRFFAKLFRYHGLESIALLGTQDWRAQELISPWDNLLEGAVFADFVGPYDKINPKLSHLKKLNTRGPNERYFVDGSQALQIDFSLIGHRAGEIALKTVMTDFLKRKQIMGKLKRQTTEDAESKSRNAFYPDRTSTWRVHLFKVAEHNLEELR